MRSNEDQSWPNFRLRIGENLLFEVKHQVEVVDGSRKLLRSIEESYGDQKVTTIETLDENTWDILEEIEETNMSEEEPGNSKILRLTGTKCYKIFKNFILHYVSN